MPPTPNTNQGELRPWQKHYGIHGKAFIGTLKYSNLNELIANACSRWPEQIAFTTCMPNGMFGSLTFAEVNRYAEQFAAYLTHVAGLKKGDRLALQLPNCMAYPIAVFGAWKAGLVVVNTNPLYTPSEMTYQFKDSGAVALVVVDMFTDKLPEVMKETQLRKVIVASVADFFPPIAGKVVKGVLKYWHRSVPRCPVESLSFNEALRLGEGIKTTSKTTAATFNVTEKDIAVLQYTGGTTGVSKGAVLTHGNLLANIAQITELAGPTIEDGKECVLTALPLYHVFAFTVNLLTFFDKGARNIFIPSPRPISTLQRAIENYPVSWITGVNTLFNALLNEEWFHETPPKTLKVGAAGGTMLHKAVANRWREVTGTPLVEGYGLTEASPVLTFNPFQGGLAKEESIGIPLPSTDIRIVDDDGQTLPVGERGELIARGPQIMQGYWEKPEETATTLRDGWLYTGDVAVMDNDGYFRIVDRKKDLILVNGFNVYPNEVEDCLALHPKVLEAAVVGLLHPESGEMVQAAVVRKDDSLTAADLIAHCREHLTAYKVPKAIDFVTELPKTPIGKILRKDIRAQYQIKRGA